MKLIRKVEHLEDPEKYQSEVHFLLCIEYCVHVWLWLRLIEGQEQENRLIINGFCILKESCLSFCKLFTHLRNKKQVQVLRQQVSLFMASLCRQTLASDRASN